MTNDPFDSPAPTGSGIDWSELNGTLIMVNVLGVETEIPTVHGPSNAVRADVVALDGAKKGDEYADTLVFPKVLQSQLKSRVGRKVLGRLGQGVAKPGQSAPWVLQDATDADKQVGVAYLNSQLASADKPPF